MKEAQARKIKEALLSALRHERPGVTDNVLPSPPHEQRAMLGDLLVASNSRWKEETLRLIDQVLHAERDPSKEVSIENLSARVEKHGTRLHVWRGDICKLNVDVIVNAANNEGLGCFMPQHRCVDNVIHRAAGPRLREECRREMAKRGASQKLTAGSFPIVTEGYSLPSRHVIHVTGPQITGGANVSVDDEEKLAAAYRLSLEAASKKGFQSIAFPCISTGLFGFPNEKAAAIAVYTVNEWLEQGRNHGVIQDIIFDVFTDEDEELFTNLVPGPNISTAMKETITTKSIGIQLAKHWIDNADAILVVAGAGMSAKDSENVYTNPQDFAKHYPWFPKWGYKTAYETMGLGQDLSIPMTAKWALYAKHMDNMRWNFAPNDGYQKLKKLIAGKKYFVWTSNVDGCFERAGFDRDLIYTPQGEWTYYQCLKPCRSDSVFKSRPMLDRVLPHVSSDGMLPADMVPRCPNCGGDVFGNVRGGGWFLHSMYEEQNKKVIKWMKGLIDSKAKVVIVEVGAGFNTPTVTRFPAESFVRELGDGGRLVRINPSDPHVPQDLKAVAISQGWEALTDIAGSKDGFTSGVGVVAVEAAVAEKQDEEGLTYRSDYSEKVGQSFGHYDWRRFLEQLQN